MTIIYYTANREKEEFEQKIIDCLIKHSNGLPIVSVSQKPMDLGDNVCVGSVGYSTLNTKRQVLIGAKKATSKYVYIAESDFLYPKEYFTFVPPEDDKIYSLDNIYLLWKGSDHYVRKRNSDGAFVCNREFLIKLLEQSLNGLPEWEDGRKKRRFFGMQNGSLMYRDDVIPFHTEVPAVTFKTGDCMSMRCPHIRTDKPLLVPSWGTAVSMNKKYINVNPSMRMWKKKFCYKAITDRVLSVKDMVNNIVTHYSYPKGKKSITWFKKTFPDFIQKIHEGKVFTDQECLAHPYADYLRSKYRWENKARVERRVLFKMRDAEKLYHSMKKHGLLNPIELVGIDDRLVIDRGGRRLFVLNALGIEKVCCRLYRTNDHYRKLNSDAQESGIRLNGDILSLGQKQFSKLSNDATDKHWVHNYLPYYDQHIGHLRKKAKKILEIGILKGASLLLWKDAFPSATIYGLDKNNESWRRLLNGQDRIEVLVGRQEDEKFITKHVIPKGEFDIIIDDGGHNPVAVKKTFDLLWDSLLPNGMYVVEDLCGNYRPDRIVNGTVTDMVKNLLDSINLSASIKAVHFYYNICFIQKGS